MRIDWPLVAKHCLAAITGCVTVLATQHMVKITRRWRAEVKKRRRQPRREVVVRAPPPPAADESVLAPVWARDPSVLVRVCLFLEPEDLGVLALVSRRFYQLTRDEALWRLQFLRRWGTEPNHVRFVAGRKTIVPAGDARLRYIQRHCALAPLPARRLAKTHFVDEVFIDVVETYTCQANVAGQIESRSLAGTILVNASITGYPACEIGFNDAGSTIVPPAPTAAQTRSNVVHLHEVCLTDYVDEEAYGRSGPGVIALRRPPVGKTAVLHYKQMAFKLRNRRLVQVAAWLEPTNDPEITRLRVLFKAHCPATKVTLLVPVPGGSPPQLISPSRKRARFKPDRQAVKWNLHAVNEGKQHSLEILLTGSMETVDQGLSADAMVLVTGSAYMLSMTSLRIRFFRVTGDPPRGRKKPRHWIRYVTRFQHVQPVRRGGQLLRLSSGSTL